MWILIINIICGCRLICGIQFLPLLGNFIHSYVDAAKTQHSEFIMWIKTHNNYVDTIILVITPESGDAIQMMKAGLIECCHIVAINKSDRPDANKTKMILKQIFHLNKTSWEVPILKIIATKNRNIKKLFKSSVSHYEFLQSNKLILKNYNKRYLDNIKDIAKEHYIGNLFNKDILKIINKEISKESHKRLSPYKMFEKIRKYHDK